jgi:hypothetical protein
MCSRVKLLQPIANVGYSISITRDLLVNLAVTHVTSIKVMNQYFEKLIMPNTEKVRKEHICERMYQKKRYFKIYRLCDRHTLRF